MSTTGRTGSFGTPGGRHRRKLVFGERVLGSTSIRAAIAAFAIGIAGLTVPLVTSASADDTAPPAAPVSYLVTFAAGTSADEQSAALAAAGATDVDAIPQLRMHAVTLPGDTASTDADALRALASVTNVNLDRTRTAEGAPDDPSYGDEWALPKIGWDTARDQTTPAGSAVVAVLDTGVDGSHPDLSGQLVPGTSVLDGSDGLSDPNGHGTAMAGIVAADTNNGTGIAGVGWKGVKIMPVTVLGADGTGQDSDIISGVVWAADDGADVILMSFSNPGYSPALQAALDYAWDKGAVLVAATGNDGSSTATFPAGSAGVVGVSNTNQDDALNSSSNYGADTFLAAPGTGIVTDAAGGGVTSVTGTSASAAMVAGAAGELAAADDTASPGTIVGRLARNADAAGTADQTGNGRLNLARALADTATEAVEPLGADGAAGGPLVGPYATAANNDGNIAPEWAPGNTSITFNTLYRVTTGGTVQHVRVTLPSGYTSISAGPTGFSSGTWGAPVVNSVNRTVDVSLTSGTGLVVGGYARIDITATTPSSQNSNAAKWSLQTFTNTAGTAGEQNDTPPVLVNDTTTPSAAITFVDAAGSVIPTPVLQNAVPATVRIRVQQSGNGIKYVDVAVPTCFSSPSGVTTSVSTGSNGGYAPIVTDGFIRMPNGTIPVDGFLTVQFTTTPSCASGVYTVSTSPSTNATNPPSTTNQSVSTTGGSIAVAAGLSDLSITKTDSPDPVQGGGNLTYTIGVNNAGPDDASAVKVVDTIPAGATFVSASGTNWNCVNASGTITCNRTGGNLAPGAAPNITVVVTAPSAPTSITNSATVSSPNDNTPANNTATASTTVGVADLSITKSDSPDPVSPNGTLTYTIGVHNAGPDPASAVKVVDTLPAGATFVSATGTAWTCANVSGTVTCNRTANLSSGTDAGNITITVTAPASGPISNSATVSSPNDTTMGNNTATAGTTIGQADLTVTKTDHETSVEAGTSGHSYAVTVQNVGSATANSVTLSDTWPAGFTRGTITPSVGTCTPGVGGNFTCAFGAIGAGASVTVTVGYSVPSTTTAGDQTNTATASTSSTETTTANNSGSDTTSLAVRADLSIVKTDGKANVTAGTSTTYSVTVTNNGPSTVPAGVVIKDVISSGTSASETEPDCAISAGAVSCTTTAALSPGGVVSYQITLAVDSGFAGSSLSNTASVVSSPVADGNSSNDSDTDTDTVVKSADVSVTKSDSPDPVVAGTDLTYTLVVSNSGPSDAASVSLTDTVPSGVSGARICMVVPGETCTVDDSSHYSSYSTGSSFPVGLLVAGSSRTIRLIVHVNPSRTADLSNTASVSSPTTDPTPANNSATAGTTVHTAADLSISKSDSPDPVVAGTDLTYTITVSTSGPSDALNSTVTDLVPVGTTFVSATGAGGGADVAGTVTWNLGTVHAGDAPVVLHLVVHVNPSRTADLSNTASVSSDTTDPDGSNNSATATTAVSRSADVSDLKVATPDPVRAGESLFYTITVSNAGPSDASGVSLVDTLPAGVSNARTCVQVLPAEPCTDDADFAAYHSGDALTLGDLSPASSWTVKLTVDVDANVPDGATLTNTAVASAVEADPNPGNNTATEHTQVVAEADLSISKSDSPDPVLAGNNLTYTITVDSAGPSDALGTTVTDAVPAGTSFVSASDGGTESAGTVTWSLGTVAESDPARVLTLVVKVNPARIADLSNTASVSSSTTDPALGNNSATEATVVNTAANLSISKSDSPDPVLAGNNLTYTITVDSAGPSDALGTTVTDAVPAGTSFVSASDGGTESAGTVTWSLGTVAESDPARVLTLVVKVNPARIADLSNTASVSSSTTDPALGNNSATEATVVNTAANLSISKSDSPDPVLAGNNLTYTITVDSAGPSDALGTTVTDAVPAGTSFVSASDGGTESAGTVTWSLGTVAESDPARVLTLVVKVNPARIADLSNTASVSSSTTDPALGNNSATEATVVNTAADLSISKSDSPDPVLAGNNLTYTITVDSAGPSDALGTTVTDAVPAGTSFVSASDGGTESAGTVTWSLGTVAESDPARVLTLVVKVASSVADGTTLSNTASVSSSTTDPDGSNNSATATTAVSRSADVSDLKVATPDPVRAGESLFYTITVSNAGPSDASGVSLVDTLPAGVSNARTCVQVLPAEPCTDDADFAAYHSGDALTLGDLSPASSWTVKLTVDVDANVPDGATLTNTAVASAVEADPNPGNNTATEHTQVVAEADLSISKSDSPDPVLAGNNLTYTITVDSAGPSDALGTTVTDAVPAGTSFVSASDGGTESAGTVTWSLGTVAESDPARVLTLVVKVNPARIADLSNTASVSSSTTDPALGNNSATEATVVNTAADLSISKSDSPDPVLAGNNLTYTITVDSAGPSDALGTTVTDAVPAGTSFVSASDGGTESAGTVTWSLGTVAESDPARVLTLVVKVNPARIADLSNTASVSSSTTDPALGNNSATEATVVNTAANLSISKSDSPDPVLAGNNLTYTITVDSAGPSDALGTTVTDAVPAGTSFVSASDGGTESAGTVTWSLGTVAESDPARVLTLVVKVNPARIADLSNTASVSSSTTDPALGNNSATEATVVNTAANLSISKSDSPDPVLAGNNLTYTITVDSAGPSDALGTTVTDAVPAGTSFVSASDGGTESAGTVTWSLGTVAESDPARVLTLVVKVNPARIADLSNTASVSSSTTDPALGNNSATEATVVNTAADLSISKSDSPDPVLAGNNLTYTITVDSAGPSDALGTTVTDAVPAGTSFVSASDGGTESAGTVTWSLGTVAESDPARVLTLVVKVASSVADGTTLSNTASVSSSTTDPDGSNNSATATTAVSRSADVSDLKVATPDPVRAGESLFYTITVSNAGPSDASGVSLVDTLPAGVSNARTCVQVLPAEPCTDDADFAAYHSGDALTLGDLSPASSWTVKLTVDVDANVPDGATLTNTAVASAVEADPNPGNNTATEHTQVVAEADLSISKSDSPDPVLAGNNLTYTITVDSAGPSDALGTTVTDAVPAGTSFVSASDGGTESAGTVTWSLGTVAESDPARVLTLVVKVNPARIADLSNTASVSSSTTDPALGNNSATEATVVNTAADLSISKSDSPDPVLAGNNLTYTITVDSAGPSDALGTTVTDAVPAGTSFVSASDGGTESAGTVTWSLGTVAESDPARVLTLVVKVASSVADGTTLSNTASVSSSTTDPDGSNNSATATTAVSRSADVSDLKVATPDPVRAGESLFYTITVSNAGPSDASGVSLVDTLPAGVSNARTCVQVLPAEPCTDDADFAAYHSGDALTLGDLSPASSWTVKLTVDVDANVPDGATLTNTAVASAVEADPNPGNNTATEHTQVVAEADLSISKSDSPDPVLAGNNLTYTITVDSAGPSDAAHVLVSDPLPAGTSFGSATDGGGGSYDAGTNTVTWMLGTLHAGDAPVVLHLVVHVNPGRTTPLSNTATVSSSTTDPAPGNNTATAATTVNTAANLSITKSDSPDPVTAGTDLTYTITVDSAGPSDALGTTVTDAVPAGTSFASATGGGGGSYDAGTNTVTWSLGTVAKGEPARVLTLVVHVDPIRTTALSNTAAVSASTTDPTPGNNTATADTTVNTAANLSITKSGPASAVAGSTAGFDYTFIVTNSGPSNQAGGFTVTDTLPHDVTFQITGSTAGCSAVGQLVSCTSSLGMTVGETRQITVHVRVASTVDAGVVLANTATVKSNGTNDDQPGNNTSGNVQTTVTEDVQLAITKTFDSTTAKAGTSGHSFTIAVSNSGASDADGVSVSDSVDPRLAVTSVVPGDYACSVNVQVVTCTLAHLAPGVTKAVTVNYAAALVDAATVSNTASVTSDEVTAQTASASVGITQRNTSTTVSCVPATVVVGQATKCTATVTDVDTGTQTAPTGTVTFSSGSGSFAAASGSTFTPPNTCALAGTTSASSSCAVTYTPTTAGTLVITAGYNEASSGLHSASSGTANLTVNKRATTTTISCAPLLSQIGQSMVCTATVIDTDPSGAKSAPTGSVSFTKDGAASGTCTLVASGTDRSACTTTVTSTTASVYNMIASYGGSGVHLPSTSDPLPTVFYDPNGGFITGGGYINHTAGMLPSGPADKANFGFVAQYKKGATIPTGETEFQYKPANINFHSTSYDWLVVNGTKAQYQGTGTVNGVPGYTFQVSVTDGGNTDTFHIKIWKTDSGVLIYDNEPTNTFSTATTITLGGNIVVHK